MRLRSAAATRSPGATPSRAQTAGRAARRVQQLGVGQAAVALDERVALPRALGRRRAATRPGSRRLLRARGDSRIASTMGP